MRYAASEKLEIIRLVEQSHLPVRKTLEKLGISRATFYLYGRLSLCKSGIKWPCRLSRWEPRLPRKLAILLVTCTYACRRRKITNTQASTTNKIRAW